MNHDFETKMCQEASDLFGTGKLNCAFKEGAEWAYKELFPMSEKWRKQFGSALKRNVVLEEKIKELKNIIKISS